MVLISVAIVGFLISLLISALVIFLVTKMFGESEGFGTALLTAFIGALIYGVTYFFLGAGFWAVLLAGIAWLIALGSLYSIGWIKSFLIAIVVAVLSGVVSWILPTVSGPL